jgi:hypothetical protein
MKLNKLDKVSDSFTIYRYDNGWMIEISGRDTENDWKTTKIVCNTEEQLIEMIKEYNIKKLDN